MSCNGFHIFLGAVVVILRICVQNPPPQITDVGTPVSSYTPARTVTSAPPSPTVHLHTTNYTRESPSKSDFNWNYSPSNNKRP